MSAFPTLASKARFVAERWRGHRIFIVFLAAFTIVSSAITVAYPLALREVVAGVEASVRAGQEARIGQLLLVLALVFAGRVVAGFYPSFRAWMNLRIESEVRADAFGRILEKDYRFQRAFRTGDVVTRLTDDVSEYPRLAWFCCSGIFRAIDSAARLLFSLGAMTVRAQDHRTPATKTNGFVFVLIGLWPIKRSPRQASTPPNSAVASRSPLPTQIYLLGP